MYVATPQVTVRSEYHTGVRDGGYAAIGPQIKFHFGPSALTPTGLVYDPSYSDTMFISICLFSFLKFRNLEAVVGGMFMRTCVSNIRCQWSETS